MLIFFLFFTSHPNTEVNSLVTDPRNLCIRKIIYIIYFTYVKICIKIIFLEVSTWISITDSKYNLILFSCINQTSKSHKQAARNNHFPLSQINIQCLQKYFSKNSLCSETKGEYKKYFIQLPLQTISAELNVSLKQNIFCVCRRNALTICNNATCEFSL